MLDIKLITIENSKIVERVVGHCTLANQDRKLTALANKYFGNQWEFRRTTPHALIQYAANIETGDVLTI